VRVAIAKPEWGFRGGFELVVDRVAAILVDAGHQVRWITVDVEQLPRQVYGEAVPHDVWSSALEYFRYLSLVEAFSRTAGEAAWADVVLCTQPGSWAVPHMHKLALFYHHLRVFYDLSERYVDAGFVDPRYHRLATAEVQAIDAGLLDGVTHFLTPSDEVRSRLARFNGGAAERCSPFLAGPIAERDPSRPASSGVRRHVLCVSRHEWPKRTELLVPLAHALPGVDVVSVGSGGRLPNLVAAEARLQATGLVADGEDCWLPAQVGAPPPGARPSTNLHLLGRVGEDDLERLYRTALCVVAPALAEDYGLTAIEAFTHGTPVIACTDGGGLAETVVDGVNGLLVEPTGAAMADAVRRLLADDDLAATLQDGARESAERLTWSQAAQQLLAGLEEATA
jgi:glycosyltransferase involved in cell wall biosynthesis